MKKLISLGIIILMIMSLISCKSSTSDEMLEDARANAVELPGIYIVSEPVLISEIGESVDYQFYLESAAIAMAMHRNIKNDIYVVTVNEYKFQIYLVNGEVVRIISEKVG